MTDIEPGMSLEAFGELTDEEPEKDAVPATPDKPVRDTSLELRGCGQSFITDGETVEIVKDVTFKAEGQETIAILGPSGCGKSTLLSMVSGMYPRGVLMPTVGEALIDDEVVDRPHDDVLTVFQSPAMCGWLSVLGNIELAFKPMLFGPRMRYPWEFLQDTVAAIGDRFKATRLKIPCSAPMKEIEDRSIEILQAVGLGDSLHKFPHQLSGGMKQRAALAFSLVVHPKVLCMDEPFSALDPTTRLEMRALVKMLKAKYPCLILFVTHDVDEALDLADRILVLSTRPATIIADIKLDPDRPDDWDNSPEHAAFEDRILHLIRDATNGGHGELSFTV